MTPRREKKKIMIAGGVSFNILEVIELMLLNIAAIKASVRPISSLFEKTSSLSDPFYTVAFRSSLISC